MDKLNNYIINNNKTHIIFDFDKTLFKLIIDWDKYFGEILDDLLRINKKIFLDYEKGKINWCEMQNLYVERYGLSMWDMIRANNIKADLVLLKKYIPNIDLINFIKNLKNDYHLYIWSSNTKELIKKILMKENLIQMFENIICSNDVLFLKPRNDGFLKIRNASVSLDNYLLVGDSKNDENAAINSKIAFYKINYFI